MSRKGLCGSEFHCNLLRNQISQVLTSGDADRCRGSQILSEGAAGVGDGGAMWLWRWHRGVSSLLSPMSTVITEVEGKQGQIHYRFHLFLVISASSARQRLVLRVESPGIQCGSPLDAYSWSNLPMWVYSFLSLSPSPPPPHSLLSASPFHSPSTEQTHYYEDTSSPGRMKEI